MICTVCGRTFSSCILLCRHIRRIHVSLVSYTCCYKHCGEVFTKLFNYERHILRKHMRASDVRFISGSHSTSSSMSALQDTRCENQEPIHSIKSRTYSPECNVNDIQDSVVQFCSQLCSKSNVTYTNILGSMTGASDIVEQVVSHVKSKTLTLLQKCVCVDQTAVQSLMGEFSKCSNVMNNLDTMYKIKKFFAANSRYVEPVSVTLGKRFESKTNKFGNNVQVEVTDTCQYIPISKMLLNILNIPSLLETIFAHKRNANAENATVTSIQDGFYYQLHTLLSQGDTIAIELYIDDVEVANPLGSHAGIHKLGFVYFTIKDLPSSLLSSLDQIYLVNVHYSIDVERYGYAKILQPLVEDLEQLGTSGLHTESVDGKVKVALWQIVGDNLALNKLFGFVESFSANFSCRFCCIHKREMHIATVEDPVLLRTKEVYEKKLAQVHSGEILPSVCGIKNSCIFNNLRYWHVTDNYAVDLMHDLFEGWVATEVMLILYHFVFEENLFTLTILNDRITNFKYSVHEKLSRPTSISFERLSQRSTSLGQSASQSWCLTRNLPLLIGDKIPEDEPYWLLFLHMLSILDVLVSPVISIQETFQLRENISDHHQCFLELFPERHLTPKMHFATHYPRIIRHLGPPIMYWSMRYESKHHPSKKCVMTSGNYINVAKTVADRHQLRTAHTLDKKTIAGPLVTHVVDKKLIQNHPHVTDILSDLCSDSTIMIKCKSLKYRGITYCKHEVVFVDYNHDTSVPVFGHITDILLLNEEPFLVFEFLRVIGFSEHYHSYRVTRTKEVGVSTVTDLYNCYPLCIRNSYALNDYTVYVTLKCKECSTNIH